MKFLSKNEVYSTLYLGCVPPLLEVALRKFFPLLSVFYSFEVLNSSNIPISNFLLERAAHWSVKMRIQTVYYEEGKLVSLME